MREKIEYFVMVLGLASGLSIGGFFCFSSPAGKTPGRPLSGRHYHVIQIVGESHDKNLPGVEILVSETGHSLVVSEECYASHVENASELIATNDQTCRWRR